MGGRSANSGLAATPTSTGPAAPADQDQQDQQTAQPAQERRLVSEVVQNMTDAEMTAMISRAQNAPYPTDARDDTIAQRIADALGISQQTPESVSQEALAAYRGGLYENGTIYRTVEDADTITGPEIAHGLTSDASAYGWNYGGGRVWGTGLYFAGTGPDASTPNRGALMSSRYGGGPGSYTMEARFRPGARIATESDLTSAAAKAWVRAHAGTLRSLGLTVNTRTGTFKTPSTWVDPSRGVYGDEDANTVVAMLMGYDALRNISTSVPYYTVFNRGALQVARGNKYRRASTETL